MKTVLENQSAEGSWEVESTSGDDIFGNPYTTSLMVLAPTTPYQILPVFQR